MTETMKPQLTNLLGKHISSFEDCWMLADEITDLFSARQPLAALPQTEGSETVREALERLIEHAQNMEHAMHPQEYMEHGPSQVVDAARQALAPPVDGWRPIETAPEGVAAQYFLPHSRTGYFDTQEVAMKLVSDADVSYWTSLGPNSGDDITEWVEQATHWRPLPPAPPAPDRGGEDV